MFGRSGRCDLVLTGIGQLVELRFQRTWLQKYPRRISGDFTWLMTPGLSSHKLTAHFIFEKMEIARWSATKKVVTAHTKSSIKHLRCTASIAAGLMKGICDRHRSSAQIGGGQRHPRHLRYGDLRILPCPSSRALQMTTHDGLIPSAHGVS